MSAMYQELLLGMCYLVATISLGNEGLKLRLHLQINI